MSESIQSIPVPATATGCHPLSSLVRILYNHNPFYVISAALFVYGLKRLFRTGDDSIFYSAGTVDYIEPWALVLSLAGVTILMGVTSILIVRMVGYEPDVR